MGKLSPISSPMSRDSSRSPGGGNGGNLSREATASGNENTDGDGG